MTTMPQAVLFFCLFSLYATGLLIYYKGFKGEVKGIGSDVQRGLPRGLLQDRSVQSTFTQALQASPWQRVKAKFGKNFGRWTEGGQA